MNPPPLPKTTWSESDLVAYLNQPLLFGDKPCPGTEGMTLQQIEDDVLRGGRFRFFLWNFSIIILSFQRNSQVRYFRSTESPGLPAFLWSLLSFGVGWWGIPWGIIYTIHTLWINSLGGRDVTTEILRSVIGDERAASIVTKATKPRAGAMLWLLRILLIAVPISLLLALLQGIVTRPN